MSVFSNFTPVGGFVDGTQCGSNTGGQVPLGLNNAFDDALSIHQTTSQTVTGPLVLSSTLNVTGVVTTSSAEVHKVALTSTTPYAVTATDRYVVVTPAAAFVVNLPVSPATGRIITVKDGGGTSSTNNITIKATQNIDGAVGSTGIVLNLNFSSVDLIYQGTKWVVV